MPYSDQGVWYPDLFAPQQLWVYNAHKRATLVCGPRLSGKTIAVLHRLMRHLWEIKGARLAMFSRTLKNSQTAGPWKKLHQDIIPAWVKSGCGLIYTTRDSEGRPGPKCDGLSRTPFFKVRNAYGTESECLLFSIDHDNDIESKLKEMEFSAIYFSELSKFRSRDVLSLGLPALRMQHLRYEDHLWIADTNPDEEGESSWIYNVWYQERVWTYDQYVANNKRLELPVMNEETFRSFQQSLELLEWGIRDNPKLDKRQIDEVEAACGYDVGLYERLVNGKWIYGQGDSSRHFRGFFRPNLHVIGNCENRNEEEWEVALPHEGCFELITGWDPGDTNHAEVTIDGRWLNGRLCFTVLDEVVSIGKEISLEAFTEAVVESIEVLEATVGGGRHFELSRSYADMSVHKYEAAGDTFPAQEIETASAGRFNLIAVPKPSGSVRLRVRLIKQLLFQGRLKISANCVHTIRMLRDLKKGQGALNFVVQDENKHVFDALSYALLAECSEELMKLSEQRSGARAPHKGKSILVSV